MRLLVIAVGTRMPAWVDQAFEDYARRMPREATVQLVEIRPEPRTSARATAALLAAERSRIEQALPRSGRLIVLDERGEDVSTRGLADRLRDWLTAGEDVAFVIGGPDGLDAALKAGADERLRLSSLTLPHALARVVLAEALYRATSLLKNHPYHRV
jgi:23S rRNA (pseudouridine1915-N3)-methyltransferase